MARERLRKAVVKARQEHARQNPTVAQIVADGVYHVARQIEDVAHPLPVFVRAPLQFVCEQLAWKLCEIKGIPKERHGEVAAYLMAGLQEFAVGLVGDFDPEHFEAWSAAAAAREEVASD